MMGVANVNLVQGLTSFSLVGTQQKMAQESWAYYVLFFSVCDISATVNVSIIFTIVQVPLYQTSSKF